jgi:hypothetical protein
MDSRRQQIRENFNNGYVFAIHRLQIQVLISYQCTPCDTVIFYTDAYTVPDAEKLLRRVEERNTAARYKLPPPQQEEFLPEPIVALPSQTSRGCANEHCSKPRNKGCTFFRCKQCCHARPILDKSCIMHRRDTNSSCPQAVVVAAAAASPPRPVPQPSQSTHRSPQATMRPPVSNDRVLETIPHFPASSSLPVPVNTQVARQPRVQRSAGPLIEERIAAPRSDFVSSGANISRQRAERSQMSRNQCLIYIWLAVCLVTYSIRSPHSLQAG